MRQLLICSLLALATVFTAAAADVTGKWSGNYLPEGGDGRPAYLVLKQSGTSITGTAGSNDTQQFAIQNGKFQDNKLSIQITTDDGVVYKCDMVLEGDHLKGDITASRDGQAMKGKIDVSRVK